MENNRKIIRDLFNQKLPGSKAHLQMIPEGRIYKSIKTNYKLSAVNIITYLNNKSLYFILTKRTSGLTNHSGQISLPGGSKDIEDKDLWETAKRETFEEIGLTITDENYIGKLTPLYIDVSNFYVQPFVSFLSDKPNMIVNIDEVENIFNVNFNTFFKKSNIGVSSKKFKNIKINYPYYNLENQQVWGATAMILQEFYMVFKNLYSF